MRNTSYEIRNIYTFTKIEWIPEKLKKGHTGRSDLILISFLYTHLI